MLLSAPEFPSKVELSARTCVDVKVDKTSPDSIPAAFRCFGQKPEIRRRDLLSIADWKEDLLIRFRGNGPNFCRLCIDETSTDLGNQQCTSPESGEMGHPIQSSHGDILRLRAVVTVIAILQQSVIVESSATTIS